MVDWWGGAPTVGSGTVVSDVGEPVSQASPISKNAANAAPVMYRVMPIAKSGTLQSYRLNQDFQDLRIIRIGAVRGQSALNLGNLKIR